jgi:hypothetical protein
VRVSKKSVCCVMIKDANQVRRVDQEHLGVWDCEGSRSTV